MRHGPLGAAIAFAVLSVFAVVVVPLGPSTDLPGSELVAHVSAHAGMIRLRALLTALALIALVVVIGHARERMEGAVGHIFVLGAAVLVAMTVAQVSVTAGLALHASNLDPVTARTLGDVASMWGPLLTVAAILLAGPVIWTARQGRFPWWLGLVAAVFVVEQVVEMLTIIGPVGSFIAPGGPMNVFLGGGLFLVFLGALGFGVALPIEGPALTANGVPSAVTEAVDEPQHKSSTVIAAPAID